MKKMAFLIKFSSDDLNLQVNCIVEFLEALSELLSCDCVQGVEFWEFPGGSNK